MAKKLKMDDLIVLAKKMNKLLSPDPLIPIKKIEQNDLEKLLKQAGAHLNSDDDDEFTEDMMKTLLILLGIGELPDPDDDDSNDADDADPDDNNDDIVEEVTLLETVNSTAKLDELKKLVKENDEFKKLRKKLSEHKNTKKLQKMMCACLDAPAPADFDDASDPVKEVKEVKEVKGKDNQAADNKAKSSDNKISEKGIGKFVNSIIEQKDGFNLSNQEILTKVKEKFPNGNTKITCISWYKGKLRKKAVEFYFENK